MKITKLLYIALLGILGFGQELPTVIPPSPEASSLAKFIESPVSYYTGTPNINIPIYTVNSGGIQIPISISYHAKGISVAEIASKVGSGWSLNAGGLISRQVRGFADESPRTSNYGYMHDNYTATYFSSPSTRVRVHNEDAMVVGGKDFYPDLYSFNFMGYSGKFIFDHSTKKPILQTNADIKIEFISLSGTSITQFIITTPDGVKYYFGKTKDLSREVIDQRYQTRNYKYSNNSSGYQSFPGGEGSFNSSWYLVEIETPNKKKIDLYYTPESVNFYSVSSVEKDPNGSSAVNYTYENQKQFQISKIEFDQGTVFFNGTTPRQDLSGSKELATIEVKDKKGNAIKKFNLNHFYTTSPDNNSVLPDLLLRDTYAKKRLFLQSVSEVGTDDQLQTYTFEYNTTVLPNRHSNATDNWGYYNGTSNNYIATFYDADRTTVSSYSEAGILKKVNYPTGGYSAFEYEQNKVIPPSFYKELLVKYSNPSENKFFGMFKNPVDYSNGKYQKPLTINGRITSMITATVSMDITNCPKNQFEEAPGCLYNIYIKDNNGSFVTRLLNGVNSISLPQGNYTIEVVPNHANHNPNVFNENYEFIVRLNWKQQIIDEAQEIFVAGKRIKKITKGEGDTVLLEKEFLYTNAEGKSSGKTHSLPSFYNIYKNISNNGSIIGNFIRGTSSGTPMSQFGGGEVGYSKVTEITKGGNESYKSEYTFTNYENLGRYYKTNFHLPTDMSWARGLPIETTHYKTVNGDSNFKTKSNFNQYLFYNTTCDPTYPITNGTNLFNCVTEEGSQLPDYSSQYIITNFVSKFPVIKPGLYWEDIPGESFAPSDIAAQYGIPISEQYRVSYFIGGRMNVSKTTDKDYAYNTTTTTEFIHDSPNHTNLKLQKTTNSNNEVIESTFLYPLDPEMATKPHVQSLKNQHKIGMPLVTQAFKNTEKLAEQETVYKDWGNGILAPQEVKTAKGSATVETKVKYNAIDTTNGNPLEVQQEGGHPICYIWGYNKTLPIAKIENATYAQVQSYVANLQTLSNGTNENDLITALDALRNALPNAMVTSYTHKPLIGISTVTDSKGDKITYHYDNFNRLQFVKDKNENILSENEYHYKN